MKLIYIFAFLFVGNFVANAQSEIDYGCGTEINAANFNRLQIQNEKWIKRADNSINKAYGTTTYYVPVQLHIIRQTAGTGGIAPSDALGAFDRLNEFYINASMHFFQCAPINYIDNSTYYDYDKTQMAALDGAYGVTDVLNIYIANTVSSSGNAICGHAQFPGGLDFVMQSTSCMKNGSTLSHEVGHYMGLYHTHESAFGDEAVNGSDCLTEGDLLCDTPADPQLSGASNLNNDGCIYYGSATDENGQAYAPSVSNAMSYSSKECRIEFSEDQYDRALWTLQNLRAYLTCSPPTLSSFFYINKQETCATSKTFDFYSAAEGTITSYSWDFGDGVGTSSQESPSYSYSNNGVYTVSLTVDDGVSNTTYSEKVVVGAVSIPYLNDFENGATDLDKFEQYGSMKNEVVVHPDAAESGAYGLLLDGNQTTSTSPSFQTPTASTAFGDLWNPYYKSYAKLCVDGSSFINLQLEFDKRQLRSSNDNYTNFRITINGVTEGSVYQVNTPNTDDPNFTHVTVDLSAYDEQVFTIGFEGSHKYDKDRNGTNNGSATFIDNIKIIGISNLYSDQSGQNADNELLGLSNHNVDQLKVYPNPTSNTLTIEANQDELESVVITNVLGQNILNSSMIEKVHTNKIIVHLSSVRRGIYYVRTNNHLERISKL